MYYTCFILTTDVNCVLTYFFTSNEDDENVARKNVVAHIMAKKKMPRCTMAMWSEPHNTCTENILLHFYTYVDALTALLQLKYK